MGIRTSWHYLGEQQYSLTVSLEPDWGPESVNVDVEAALDDGSSATGGATGAAPVLKAVADGGKVQAKRTRLAADKERKFEFKVKKPDGSAATDPIRITISFTPKDT